MKLSVISPMMVLNGDTARMAELMMRDVAEERSLHEGEIEFIIVDNASTHGSFAMIANSDIYVKLPKNRGWGGGLNAGMKLASGDYLLFANNDVRIKPGWFSKLIDRFESSEKIGTISIHSRGGFSGAFFAVRREIYELIGDFDEENFPLGHAQDCDYLYRLMKEGWDDNVLVYPDYSHLGRRTYNQGEFMKEYREHPNFSKSDFLSKWGFREQEWEARGHADWLAKITEDPSLDRFGDLEK
jgi:GT2 family glycosyltransferase